MVWFTVTAHYWYKHKEMDCPFMILKTLMSYKRKWSIAQFSWKFKLRNCECDLVYGLVAMSEALIWNNNFSILRKLWISMKENIRVYSKNNLHHKKYIRFLRCLEIHRNNIILSFNKNKKNFKNCYLIRECVWNRNVEIK